MHSFPNPSVLPSLHCLSEYSFLASCEFFSKKAHHSEIGKRALNIPDLSKNILISLNTLTIDVQGELTGKATQAAIQAMRSAVMVACIMPAVIVATTTGH